MQATTSDCIGFSKGRFESLTDGIFAFAMTLLALAGATWSTTAYLLIPPLIWALGRA